MRSAQLVGRDDGGVPVARLHGGIDLGLHLHDLAGRGQLLLELDLERLPVPLVPNDPGQDVVHISRAANPFDPSVLADDEGGGDELLCGRLHVGIRRGSVGVGCQRVVDLLVPENILLVGLAQEPHDRLDLLVADPDEGHVVVLVLLLELADVRDAGLARPAPGGPELQHVDLARLELLDLGALQPVGDVHGGGLVADGQDLRTGPAHGGDPEGQGTDDCSPAHHDVCLLNRWRPRSVPRHFGTKPGQRGPLFYSICHSARAGFPHDRGRGRPAAS
jgi:hypothetical protein